MLQQPLHETISQDPHQVVTLLEYVRYDKSKSIQRQSLKVMELLRYVFVDLLLIDIADLIRCSASS